MPSIRRSHSAAFSDARRKHSCRLVHTTNVEQSYMQSGLQLNPDKSKADRALSTLTSVTLRLLHSVYGNVVLCTVAWLVALPESYSPWTGGCWPFRISHYRATILVVFGLRLMVPVRVRLCRL